MATTTTQYVTTDYLNNEEFLKASNIKAGSNITLSTSGKDVTINASGGTELNYYHEYIDYRGAWIDANSFQVNANSTFVFGPLYAKTSMNEYSNGIILEGNNTTIGAANANVSLQGEEVSITNCSTFKVGPVHAIELKTNNSLTPDFIGCEAHLDNNNAYLYANSAIELHANSTFVFGPLYAGGTEFFAGPDGVLVHNVKPVLNVTSSDGTVTINKSGYNLDLKANGGGTTLTYYHESGTDVSIETPDHINFKANDTIYFDGPSLVAQASTMDIYCNDKITLTASATDNYINLANDCIEINADTNANIIGSNLHIKSYSSAYITGPTIQIGNKENTGSSTQTVNIISPYTRIYNGENGTRGITYSTLNDIEVIRLESINSIFAQGPYVFIGDATIMDGIQYEKKSNDKTSINLNANVIHANGQSTVFITSPQFTVGADDSSTALEFVDQGAHNHIILNVNSVYIIGPDHGGNDFYVKATNTRLSSSTFAIGPCGLLSMESDKININSPNSVFISGPSIQLNQPAEPGISISPNNIEISMTTNPGTSSQDLGTTLTLTKNDANISVYATGTGKEFEFNVNTVDVLDRNINKYFENLTRVDGEGGSGVWPPMKNHGVYYIIQDEHRPDGDWSFNFPVDGQLAIDMTSDSSIMFGNVRTVELHIKHNKNTRRRGVA